MARPIWKGHITFGLVNIPVTLFSGERRSDLHFRMLDSRNNARVRYERVNETTGEEVPWNNIVKAFEYDSGSYVVLSEEDFERVAVEASKTIEIEDFVAEKAIDYPYFDKPYYLVPGAKGEKGYVLLRETLQRTKKVGIARVVIRTRQYLAALMPQRDALILNILRYPQELRDEAEYDLPTGALEDYKINDKELTMAEQLVESMTSDWEPEKYHDEYREALLKWIDEKISADGEAAPAPAPDEPAPAGEIIDIMGLLKKSIEEKGEKPAAKKSPAKSKAKAEAEPKAKAKPKSKSRKKASGE